MTQNILFSFPFLKEQIQQSGGHVLRLVSKVSSWGQTGVITEWHRTSRSWSEIGQVKQTIQINMLSKPLFSKGKVYLILHSSVVRWTDTTDISPVSYSCYNSVWVLNVIISSNKGTCFEQTGSLSFLSQDITEEEHRYTDPLSPHKIIYGTKKTLSIAPQALANLA